VSTVSLNGISSVAARQPKRSAPSNQPGS
jgi:hypothetical protein